MRPLPRPLTMLWRGRSADNRSRLPAAIHALARTHVGRRPIASGAAKAVNLPQPGVSNRRQNPIVTTSSGA